jgi:tripartite-type tricarboxylate transporter receptor subunit TctC
VESGYKELVNREWFSYFIARGVGDEMLARLRGALRKVAASAEVRSRLLEAGLEMGDGEAEPLAATMRREYEQWKHIVKETGFVAD